MSPTNLPLLSQLLAWPLALVLWVLSNVATAQWFGSGTVELRSINNISRSPLADFELSDSAAQATISGGHYTQVGDYNGLTLGVALSREQYRRFTGLSNHRLGTSASISHKFGLGERATVVELGANIERALFNSNARNLWIYGLQLSLRRRLSDSLALSAHISYDNQQGDNDTPRQANVPTLARPGDVWNQKSLSASANLEWDTGASSWLTATLQYRRGDISASIPPQPAILARSTAVTADPVYAAVFSPVSVAYRLDARSRSLGFDWNLAVGESATVFIGAESQYTDSGTSLFYRTGIIRAGLVYGF